MPRWRSARMSSGVAASSMPHFRARARVQVGGERLGQPIGQRLDEDRVVVVVCPLEAPREVVGAEAGRDGERADVVGGAGARVGDEIGERQVRLAVGDRLLLPQHVEAHQLAGPALVAEEHDVVAVAGGRPEAVDAARRRAAARRRSDRAACARCRTARAPPRRTAGGRESPGSGPSAPTPRRRTSSRCTARGRRAARRRARAGRSNDGRRQRLAPPSRSAGGSRARPRTAAAAARGGRCAARAASSCSARFACSNCGRSRRRSAGSTRRRPRATRRARAPSPGCTPARSSPPCAAGSSSRRR